MWYNSSVIRNLVILQPSSQPAVVREEAYEINEGRFSQVDLGKIDPSFLGHGNREGGSLDSLTSHFDQDKGPCQERSNDRL